MMTVALGIALSVLIAIGVIVTMAFLVHFVGPFLDTAVDAISQFWDLLGFLILVPPTVFAAVVWFIYAFVLPDVLPRWFAK